MTFRSRVLGLFAKRMETKQGAARQRQSRRLRNRSLFLEGLESRQVLAAEVNVLGNGVTIVDGDVTPDSADHTQFVNTAVSGNSTRTYTIQNLGDSDLTLGTASSSSARFTISNFPAGPIAAGGSATFDVTFSPIASGNVTATISFVNDDADENPYNFSVLGVGNSAPVFSQPSYSAFIGENLANNSVVTFTQPISATDANSGMGDTVTYSIVGGNGTGGGAFKINASTGVVQVNDFTQLDYEKTTSFALTVRATDSLGAFANVTANVTLFNQPEPPVITAGQQFTIPENSANGFNVGTVVTTFDVTSLPANRSFSIIAGNTSTAFAISNTGVLTVANTTALDFETVPLQKFTLTIRAMDSVNGNDDETVVINLTNVNEAPTNITLTPTSIAENQPGGTTVGTLSTTDVDALNTHTYSFVAGAGDTDNASFSITGNELKIVSPFNFEVKNSYSVRLRTTDQGGLTFDKAFTISVTNVNDAPTLIALSNDEIAENDPVGTTIGNLSTTDEDAGETFTYTLVPGAGGDDNASFAIVGNQLKSNAVFDFETKSSYTIRVRSTDSGALFTESVFVIEVLDQGEGPTDISLSNSSIDENNSVGDAIGTLTTTDGDPLDTFTYTLVAGEGDDDNASFTIDGDTLKAAEAFDFEAKSSYTVRIRSTDPEMLFFEKSFTISIANVNEAPTAILLSDTSIVEEEPIGTAVATLSTTDGDAGETFTYTLVSGAGSTDNASFTIDGDVLKSAAVFDYQTDNSYDIRIRSTDSDGLFTEQAFTISISDVRINGFTGALAVAYRENAVPALIASVGSIADVQLVNFDGGTLTVWLSNNGTAEDKLSIKHTSPANGKVSVDYNLGKVYYTTSTAGFYEVGTFTGGTNGAPLVITFNASAFKTEVQAVLKAITFSNVSDNPLTLPRTVSFVVSDGDGGTSNTASRTVNVTAVNDKPVVSVSGTNVSHTEGGPAVIIDASVVISDVDSADLAGGKLTVKAASGGHSSDRFAIEPGGLVTVNTTTKEVSYDGVVVGVYAGTATFTVTFNGSATPAAAQAIARRVSFFTASDAQTATARGISYTLSDGDGGTSPAALGDFASIVASNDAPTLTLTNTVSAKYTENAVPVAISTAGTVVDVDLLNFDSGTLTVQITGNGEATDALGVKNVGLGANQVSVAGNTISFTNASLVTYAVATFTGGDGVNPLVITFNANALKTEVQAVMKAITFASSSDNPSTAQRTVSFTLTDGDGGTSNTVVRSVDIILKNDPPAIGAFGADLDYTIGTSAILVADSATISDIDSTDFNTGKLTVALGTGKNAADRIKILDGNGITAAAGVVSYNGDAIGTYTGTTTLIITFNSALVTPAVAQVLLRQIGFDTTVLGTSATRALTATLTDGDGGTSAIVSKVITVHNPMV